MSFPDEEGEVIRAARLVYRLRHEYPGPRIADMQQAMLGLDRAMQALTDVETRARVQAHPVTKLGGSH